MKSSPLYAYRISSSFDVVKMKKFMGGEDYEIKLKAHHMLSIDPIVRKTQLLDMTFQQHRKWVFQQNVRLRDLNVSQHFSSDPKIRASQSVAFLSAVASLDNGLSAKHGLHMGMFINCIKNLGTERHQHYVPMCERMEIFGSFALTELSHGSNAKAMQTTATFDIATQEFVINSPSHEAYKWWIGMAGQTANYTCLMAKLIVNGKNYGLHPFLVPIRSLVDHTPLPGVHVGDMGHKPGLNGIDNGFIGFDNFRIPRENLLNFLADVLPDGTYTAEHIPANQRFALLLNPLSAGRVGIVGVCQTNLINALTIAIRYSAVRKQFGPGKEEIAVIEYQTQQYRLFPHLAAAYAIEFFRKWLSYQYAILDQQMAAKTTDKHFLNEMHALSSAAKPLAGWQGRDAIQTARECCGGHGYSGVNRIGLIRDDHDPNLTYEGENWVLIQQTEKYLLDLFNKKLSNPQKQIKTPLGTVNDWINSLEDYLKEGSTWGPQNESEVRESRFYLQAFHFRILSLLQRSMEKVSGLASQGTDLFTSFSESQVFHLHSAAKAYAEFVVVTQFLQAIQKIGGDNSELRQVLQLLCNTYALSKLELDLSTLRDRDYVSSKQANWIRKQLLDCCKQIKGEAVSLVDALAPPDELLNSPIGASDGDVYKRIFNAAISGPNAMERPDWWTITRRAAL
eukprot:TRINITY_DN4540_c0_g1_i1.p1 TRINITY_DN4540_c0_g1~~TRINITY_DN4540_c0_g1_i1.p1  ORF type:complete len:754 (-),score=248.75 TRINITY_DN4540_c0_g1_i1:175-2205(-)